MTINPRLTASLALLALPFFAPADEAQRTDPPDLHTLVAAMTLEEKIGQLALRGRGSSRSTEPLPDELIEAVRAGRVGSVINLMVPAEVDRLQRIAVEESPRGIPLLFGRDVIHGLHAVAPIPLAQAATWNPSLVEEGARAMARDAVRYGIRWTFAPMVDVTRDPRWGRIAESPGEDPYLAARMAEASVRGLQGDDPSAPDRVAACLKHFAAYGAAEGGRDYNTTSMSQLDLRNVYLPPFRAGIEAGALTLMTGFNELNGVPATAHSMLLSQILRDEWGFRGFVVSDWNSLTEMIEHGYSADAREAARQALTAGLDQEMMSTAFEDHLADLVEAGEISESTIDDAVLRILRVKRALGLFERPERQSSKDPTALDDSSLEVAYRLALESVVLLENDGVLPLTETDELRVAVVGPLADAPHEQLGTWSFDGRAADSRTPVTALRERLGERVAFAPGLSHSRDTSHDGFAAALDAARRSDVVLFFGGEEAILSGEAHSRADLALPGAQVALLRELRATGKPMVLVLLAGRPSTFEDVDADAILAAWHPGTMAGPALAALLFGDVSPSGRLPVTWPRAVGQIPMHYNHKRTGRPADPSRLLPFNEIPIGAWQSSLSNTSHYLDLGTEPAYPFGHGLGYSRVDYRRLTVEPQRIGPGETVQVAADVANVGSHKVVETVQLYLRDLVASPTRPVRELAGFERVALAPGETRRVVFKVDVDSLAWFDGEAFTAAPGEFAVWIAPDARSGLEGRFELVAGDAEPGALPAPRPVGSIERLDPRLDALLPRAVQPVAVATGFTWSEGPVWLPESRTLLVSDVPENTIWAWSEADGLERWLGPSGYTGEASRGGEMGSNGLWLDRRGGEEGGDLLLCQHGDRRVVRLRRDPSSPSGFDARFETVADRFAGRRFNSPNDLVVGTDGSIYFTDPPYGLEHGPDDPARELPFHGVFHLPPDAAHGGGGHEGTVRLVSDALSRPNGIALSPCGHTLYVANSDPAAATWTAWELDDSGTAGASRVFFDATERVGHGPGLPDGMVVDHAGNLFATGPGGVLVLSPDGDHLGTIRLDRPVANVTFGGADGSTLYLTADDLLVRVRTRTRGLAFD
ncbi:MAG: glycoside hydrolase family 3 N-terminal domain-containing protein [Acidobacteriota bacterium]